MDKEGRATITDPGRKLTVLTAEEERNIAKFVNEQCEIAYGLTSYDMKQLIQEVLINVTQANPHRADAIPKHWVDMYPDDNFVHNFAHRNNLVQRCTGEVSKARSIISPESLRSWQADTEGYLVLNDKFKDIWTDNVGDRIFNMDETAICCGSGDTKVWVERGRLGHIYDHSGNTRLHVTCNVTVNAAGKCAGVHIVYKGKVNDH